MRPNHSEGVRRVLAKAQEAAGKFGHRFVHTEYLLLGLLHERNTAVKILKDLGIERETLRRDCERLCRRGHHAMEPALKLTPRVQHILALSGEEMEAMGETKMDTRHLLLGILREEEGLAGRLLRDIGITEAKVRGAIVQREASGEKIAQVEAHPRPERHVTAASNRPFWRFWSRT